MIPVPQTSVVPAAAVMQLAPCSPHLLTSVACCHVQTIVDILIIMLQPGLCSEDTLAGIDMQPHESFPLWSSTADR